MGQLVLGVVDFSILMSEMSTYAFLGKRVAIVIKNILKCLPNSVGVILGISFAMIWVGLFLRRMD